MVDSSGGGRRIFGLFIPDETPEYVAAHDAWTAALGKLVYQFSEVEHHLRRLLIRLTGVSNTIGRALFHSDRVGDLKDSINRVLETTGRDDMKGDLEPFFSQLTVINGVRNNIVHWGGLQLESGDYLVSNLHAAPVEKGRGHRVNVADMNAMVEDLHDICAALVVARERTRMIGRAKFNPQPLPASWQYKPRPLPPLNHLRRRALFQKRPRPPAASQGKPKQA